MRAEHGAAAKPSPGPHFGKINKQIFRRIGNSAGYHPSILGNEVLGLLPIAARTGGSDHAHKRFLSHQRPREPTKGVFKVKLGSYCPQTACS